MGINYRHNSVSYQSCRLLSLASKAVFLCMRKQTKNAYIYQKDECHNFTSLGPCKQNQTKQCHHIEPLYTDMAMYSVSFTHSSRRPTYPHLKLLWLRYESMYQSSESRWDRNPLTDLWSQSVVEKPHGGRFTLASKTQGHGTMGDNSRRESRGDYISGSVRCSAGGAGGAKERTHGVELRELTQADRG